MPDIFTSPKTNINNHNPEHVPVIKLNTPGLFASFVNRPNGLKFAHQEKNEEVILFTRRNFVTNFPWIAITFIALFIPLIFTGFLQLIGLPELSIKFTTAIIILLFYNLVIIGYAFYNYIEWFYNIGIITNKRLLDIDFLHLSYIDIAITQLPEIEDVVHRQKGFFASYYDYGDVVAHTVASREDFVLEKIPHPTQVVDILSKLIADK